VAQNANKYTCDYTVPEKVDGVVGTYYLKGNLILTGQYDTISVPSQSHTFIDALLEFSGKYIKQLETFNNLSTPFFLSIYVFRYNYVRVVSKIYLLMVTLYCLSERLQLQH